MTAAHLCAHNVGVNQPHLGTMTDHAKAAAAAHAKTIEALYDLHCWAWDETTDLEGLNSESLSILESLKPLATFSDTLERIEDYAREMPLSVLVRSGWYAPGEPTPDAAEFELLLSTGGPACRIIGAVCNDSPVDPILQWQDWFTPWSESDYSVNPSAIDWFCQLFYYSV